MSIVTRLARVCLALSVAVLAAALVSQLPVRAQSRVSGSSNAKAGRPADGFDIRMTATERAQALRGLQRDPRAATRARVRQAADAAAKLRADLPDAEVRFSPVTGAAELVRVARGALTAPAPGASGRGIVSAFLQDHAALFGLASSDVPALSFRGESVSPGSGLRMVRFDQSLNGHLIFQSDSRFVLDRDGRLVRALGQLVPTGLADAADATATAPVLTPADALVIAMQSVGITIAANDVTVAPGTPDTPIDTLTVAAAAAGIGALPGAGTQPGIGTVSRATTRLVYFPLAPGTFALAYQVAAPTSGAGDWLTLVDATTGTLLWRHNARAYQTAPTRAASFGVYVQADGVTPADSPAPLSPTVATPGSGLQATAISRTQVSMATAMDPVASPAGWLADATETTTGNNVDACVDRLGPDGCDAGTLDQDGRPRANPNGAAREFFGNAPFDFSAPPAPLGTNPDAGTDPTGVGAPQDSLRRGAVTQLFYITNWYHDRLYRLGFDEAAGNFQTVNFSGQGTGGDAVRAEVQDSSGTDNANFATFPDGQAGRMQMYRFTGPSPGRDAAFDAEIVIHELTHGLTNRLIGNGAGGLAFGPGGSLGEGWGDFYAMSLLNSAQTDNPDGRYAFGAYSTYRLFPTFTDNYLYGIRRYPYSTDNTINPLTWADVDDVTAGGTTGTVPRSPGYWTAGLEVHNAGELWALSLWEVRSRIIKDPAGANGNVALGNRTMLQIVTDAIKLTPITPSFIDARDALIDADCAANACANERWIWEGFADRGLGYGAVAPVRYSGFYGDIGHMSIGTSFATPSISAAGHTIVDTAGNGNGGIDPGEPVRLAVNLTNPWRRASQGVPNATATLTTTTPGVTIMAGTVAYATIAASSTAGPAGPGFLFLADPALTCGGAIQFKVTITSALGTSSSDFSVRVGLPGGVGAPRTYSRAPNRAIPDNDANGVFDALTITDDFEIADLDFRVDELRHTFTGDLSVLLRSPSGYGNDLIFYRGLYFGIGDGDDFVDTVIDQQSTNDLNQTEEMDAPFTGRWTPAFNSQLWTILAEPNVRPDPIGQLSRLNGTSTRGTWHALVSDVGELDTGTFNRWSLIVTPRLYTCAPFVDAQAPVTTINLAPPAPNGTNGWYKTAVPVTVTAVDGPAAVSLATETRCIVDPATPPATFAELPAGCAHTGAGAPVDGSGTHTVWAASRDFFGNAGTPVSATFKIDRTPPVLTCPVPPRFSVDEKDALIIASVTDDLSGVPPTASSLPVNSTVTGPGTIIVSATDAAGNVGTATCGYTIGNERTYYLTEGSTGFFKLKVALANPNPQPAPITIAYVRDDGEKLLAQRTLEPMSRTTIDVNAVPGLETWPVSVIVTSREGLQLGVERTMTWDHRNYSGHGSLAADSPRLRWTFGEGAQGFFNTYFFLLNPNAEASTATVRFLRESGAPVLRRYELPAFSRQVIDAGDVPEIASSAFGMVVDATRAIVAERSTYFSSSPQYLFKGGQSSLGSPDASRVWYFAEGATGSIFDAYILVANPGDTESQLTLRFLLESGEVITAPFRVGGGRRLSVDVESVDPRLRSASFSLELNSSEPVVAERAMYWGGFPWQEAHDSLGLTESGTDWVLGEGRVGGQYGHQTYILLGNTNQTEARVTITYLRENGKPTIVKEYAVKPTSRLSISVNGLVPELQNESFGARVTVTNGVGILVERAMYWDAEGMIWAGGTNATGKKLVP